MSFHKNPKYQIPELIQALKDPGLEHDTPSQLADAFRTGWVAKTALLASAAGGQPRAWLTEHDSGDMVWTDKAEAEAYADDAGPLPLYTAPPPPVGELQGVSELSDEEIFAFADSIDAQCTVLDPQACRSMGLPIGTRSDGNLTNEKMLAITRHFSASRPAAPVAAVDAAGWIAVDQALINRISQEDSDTDYWLYLFSGTVCKGRYLWRQGHSPDRFVGEVGDVPALGNYVSHIAPFKTPPSPPKVGIGEPL